MEFQKRALPPSLFLAGPTFVPLWVSHKLKTNPVLFFSFFSFFQKGKATEKPILLRFFWGMSCAARVENSAFSLQKKKTAFLRSFGLRYSPTFSLMAIPFWDGHAWEVFSSLPGFYLAISIPLSEKRTPKWRFFHLFLAVEMRFFFTSHWVESKFCESWAIEVLQPVFPQCELFVKE